MADDAEKFAGEIRITLNSDPRHSNLLIRSGLIGEVGALCKARLPRVKRCLVVSDTNVGSLYGEKILAGLNAAGIEAVGFAIPAGENSKSFAQAEAVYEAAIAQKLSRTDLMIALGGGVVGDLTGFCAGTYYRGISFVQIPTTLVAQVDSSIGGKTALNTRAVKNAVGTFYQPQLVLIDPDTLKTLPAREVKAGLAEVAKYALIEESCTGKSGFLEFLEAHAKDLTSYYKVVIQRCCEIKARVVQEDELDIKGVRAFLNLGHTFGHAYETLTGYDRLLHGEAVALGILKACRLSETLNLMNANHVRRIQSLFARLDLAPESDWEAVKTLAPEKILDLMRQDKKAEEGVLKLVLPSETPGRVILQPVPEASVLAMLP